MNVVRSHSDASRMNNALLKFNRSQIRECNSELPGSLHKLDIIASKETRLDLFDGKRWWVGSPRVRWPAFGTFSSENGWTWIWSIINESVDSTRVARGNRTFFIGALADWNWWDMSAHSILVDSTIVLKGPSTVSAIETTNTIQNFSSCMLHILHSQWISLILTRGRYTKIKLSQSQRES